MPQDIFHPLSKIEREEKLAALGEFVQRRDGVSDFSKRTLSHREAALQRFEDAPVLYPGVVDRPLFEAQYGHLDKRRSTPRELLLLFTFIKFNNAEAFAVERSFHAVTQGIVRPKNDIELVLLLEEHYHTKITDRGEALGCRSDTDQYLGPNSWGYWVLYSICSPVTTKASSLAQFVRKRRSCCM